jgi:diguanylate cyclase (GGDEF)-like protein
LFDWEYKEYFFETSISPIYNQKHQVIGSVLISRDVTEYKKRQAEIEYINQHDYLTDLYNRRMLIEKFNELNQKQAYPITVMMMDLNGLKMLNDAFGHHIGDDALVEVANAFRKVFKNDFVFRIGGDEFAVILTKCDESEIENFKQELRRTISSIMIKKISLSISVGYHMIDEDGHDINDVLKEAENNMYRHKVTESMSVRNQAIRAIHKTLTDKFKEERMHSEKVSQLCYVMGLALGIKDELLEELKLAGLYHDIGKIAIPDAILDKPDTLTDEEFELMKTHTEIGYRILRAADDYSRLAEYALSHHERWDGKGYPRGIEKEDIPLFARIIALADSYDAMTTNRVYRPKMTKDKAIDELVRGAGKQYDPKLTKIFIKEVLKRPIEAEKVEL